MFQHHLLFWPGDPCCCRRTESSRLVGCRPALLLDRVQQIVKERFDPTVRWRKLRSCKCSTRYLEPVRWCSATPSPVWRGEMRTFDLAACNRALNYPEKLFWLQVLSSPATATTKNKQKTTTKSEGGMQSKFAARSATFAPETYSFDVSVLLILSSSSFAALCMLHFPHVVLLGRF